MLTSLKPTSIHKNALMELQGCQGSGQDHAVAVEMHMAQMGQQPDFPSTPSMGKLCTSSHHTALPSRAIGHTRRFKTRKKKKKVPFASRRSTIQECRAFNRSMEIKPFQYHKMRWSRCNLRPPDLVQPLWLLCLPPQHPAYGQ